jgi:energy-coupling factor transporter ATP-binding protein EcfA2
MDEDLKVIEIRGENIMRMKVFHVKPDPNGNLTLFTGRNGQGKTSALNHLSFALGGEKLITKVPIREGETSASDFVDLGKYKITRTWTPKKSYLKVVSSDGGKYGQTLLDELVGDLSFCPVEFIRMGKKKQRDVLLGLVDLGIDLDQLAKERKEFYNERTLVNKDLQKKRIQLEGITKPDTEYLKDEISLIKLLNDLDEARDKNLVNKDARDKLEELEKDIFVTEKELEMLRNKIVQVEADLRLININLIKQKEIVEKLEDADCAAIKSQINNAEEINKKIRDATTTEKKISDLNIEIESIDEKGTSLSKGIAKIDHDKDVAIQEAKFPIAGLSVNVDGVLYKEFPFEQAGSAEKIEVAFAIKVALNPRLKIVLIDEIGDLDSQMLNKLVSLAKENKFHIFATKVDESGEVGIVIEDGEVVSRNPSMPTTKP